MKDKELNIINVRNSSIVIGIILSLILFVVTSKVATFNLKEALIEYKETINNNDVDISTMGELSMIYVLVAGIGVLALYLYGYCNAITSITGSIVLLVVSIKNIKVESKCLKIINYGYIGLTSFVILFCLIKLVLYIFNLG